MKLPKDILAWKKNKNNCAEVFNELGFRLLTKSDISSIENKAIEKCESELEKKALQDMFNTIYFEATIDSEESDIFGYWLHEDISIEKAPIVSWDSELDFFMLAEGSTITEALLVEKFHKDKKAFKKYRKILIEHGFEINKQKDIRKRHETIESIIPNPDDILDKITTEHKYGRDLSHLKFEIKKKDFKEWRTPRYGTDNPTKIKSDVWASSFITRENTYQINKRYNIESQYDDGYVPTWCFDRFGFTRTLSGDKEIYIAGEHEDYYDPDFYIYNDVIVVYPDDTIEFYNYPKDIFPPTDFHTATLIDENTILIIGNLGYVDSRQIGTTQVYSLDTQSFRIKKIETQGENPGWISSHNATLSDDATSIVISGGKIDSGEYLDNLDSWELDLKDYAWKRLTRIRNTRWVFTKVDNTTTHLWEIRHNLWRLNVKFDNYKKDIKELKKKLGYDIEIRDVEKLYRFDDIIGYRTITDKYDNESLFEISINDIKIVFDEDMGSVTATIFGELEETVSTKMRDAILHRLERLENSQFEVKTIKSHL